MTNKKVIIDKVNVSGCEYLYTDSTYNDKCCSASIGGDCLCKPSEMLCVKYVEHLKEQLKRKEQECEELKKTLIEIKEIAKYDVYTTRADLCLKLNWIKKQISECEMNND